jgi:DNA (cytosine-5)-methyltransferase 1
LIPKGIPNFKSNVEVPDLSPVMEGWDPQDWNLEKHLPLDKLRGTSEKNSVVLSEDEKQRIDAWNEFVLIMRERLGDANLPGFPIWADHWVHIDELKIPRGTPDWKKNFLTKNAEFYTAHRVVLNKWLKKWNYLENFPPSRRKLEWQAQNTKSLWETVMHLRPSGIRAKKATYVPALVAITQTSIVGKHKRRITVREGARLQGLPEWFDFVDQSNSKSYKQLGNGVNVGAVYNVIRAQVARDLDLLEKKSCLTTAILSAPANPDEALSNYKKFFDKKIKSKETVNSEIQVIKSSESA